MRSKPLILQKAGSRWEVYLDVTAARSFRRQSVSVRRRLEKYPEVTGLVPLCKTGERSVDFVVGGKPHKFAKKEDAESAAFSFGNYALELGLFSHTYIEERR